MELNRRVLFLALITLLALSAGAQKIETSITYLSSIPDPGNNYIVYDRHRKLSIEDFKGKPEEESVAAAITNSGFMFKAGYRNVNGKATLSITVYCSFDKELSWMKQKAKTAYILSHEQHHFDITYIGTLLFIKKLKQVNFNQEKYKEQLHNLYNEVVIDMQKLQNRYDTETNNGILTDKQAMWNIKIDEQLASLLSEGN